VRESRSTNPEACLVAASAWSVTRAGAAARLGTVYADNRKPTRTSRGRTGSGPA